MNLYTKANASTQNYKHGYVFILCVYAYFIHLTLQLEWSDKLKIVTFIVVTVDNVIFWLVCKVYVFAIIFKGNSNQTTFTYK